MNVGILGAGEIAIKMATTLQPLKDVRCYAIASRSEERAQDFADKYGFDRAYGSYLDMLNDEYVDLVYIATPHSHHYEHIKMCLERGKHVLVEKPIAANAKQTAEVLQMAEERGLLLTEAMWTRYMPMLTTIQELVASGMIGKITSMTVNVGFPMENKERLVRPDLAGGALLDVGCYAIHFASMIFGNDISGISASCTKLPSGVDAQETIILNYSDGRMASLFSTMLAETDRRAIIHGTNGFIEVENIINFETVRAYNLERKVIAEYTAPYQVTGYEYEVQSAIRSIRNGWLECPELDHATTYLMMQIYDNLRDAFGVVFPFETDPSISPVLLGEEIERERRNRESSVKEISNTASKEADRAVDETVENEETNDETEELPVSETIIESEPEAASDAELSESETVTEEAIEEIIEEVSEKVTEEVPEEGSEEEYYDDEDYEEIFKANPMFLFGEDE